MVMSTSFRNYEVLGWYRSKRFDKNWVITTRHLWHDSIASSHARFKGAGGFTALSLNSPISSVLTIEEHSRPLGLRRKGLRLVQCKDGKMLEEKKKWFRTKAWRLSQMSKP